MEKQAQPAQQQPKQKTKVRFTSLDVAAQVAYMRNNLLGCRVTNIYDLNPTTYLFKLSGGDDKNYLLVENGVRFHTTQIKAEKNKMPSGFTMKFRKFLRSKRLEDVRQVGVERVVVLTFGSEAFVNHLILELYAQGNIILTDADYRILQCIRSHQFTDKIKTAVGELYPFEYAANIYLQTLDTSDQKLEAIVKESEAQKQEPQKPEEEQKGKKNKKKEKNAAASKGGIKLKDLVFKAVPCLFPQVIDHILLTEGLNNNQKCTSANLELSKKAVDAAVTWTRRFVKQQHKGYLLVAEPKEEKEKYCDFAGYLHAGYEGREVRTIDNFSKAVDTYFSNFKKPQEGEDFEELAWRKYEQIKNDQEGRVEKLRSEQEEQQRKAELIEKNIDDVDAIIKIFKTMLDNGYSWTQISKMITDSRKSGDPLANMIHNINLEKKSVAVLLADPAQDQLNDLVAVDLNIEYNAYTNATLYYDSRKKNYQKQLRTKEACEQVLKVAEKQAIKDIERKKNQRQANIVNARKPYWFEKFYWFITSQGYLVISGRDSHTNQMIVKKYMRPGDLYMHSDYGGAASTVIKNPSKEPVPRPTLEESAIFTVCRSKAWDSKIISGAWWVYHDQVSKSAPTGEFLPTGSFMIRGKKNFVYPNKMEMGITLLYRLDPSCVAKHLAEKQAKMPQIGKIEAQVSEIEKAHEEKANEEEFSIINLEVNAKKVLTYLNKLLIKFRNPNNNKIKKQTKTIMQLKQRSRNLKMSRKSLKTQKTVRMKKRQPKSQELPRNLLIKSLRTTKDKLNRIKPNRLGI